MIVLIDNYDSFSYNLYQMLGEMDPDIEVYRNDAITAEEILEKNPKAIVLSPGPGKPSNAGICEETVKICAGRIPILGVCLGHQAICESFGAMIVHAKELMHGKQSVARLNRWSLLFKGLPDKIKVARYHSLAVRPDTLPRELRVSAVSEDGEIMAVEHERAPIYGLQFHPESIMTQEGRIILKNFLAIADSFPKNMKERVALKEVQPFKPPVLKREEVTNKVMEKEREREEEKEKEKKNDNVRIGGISFEEVKATNIQGVPRAESEEEDTVKDTKDAAKVKGDKKMVITEAIVKLVNKEDLSPEMAEQSMNEIMSGEVSQILISSFLTALQAKGATNEEIAACAKGMRSNAIRLEHNGDVLEIVGTGGDKSNSFNISTASALILAAAGVKVAKHGNRAATSKCGTADCLEQLGVNISLKPEEMSKVLDKTNLAFMFAQVYHTSMKYVAPVRKELPMPTVFNVLGPLTNPAFPTMQLLGVYKEDMVEPMTRVLASLGVKKAMTVYGQDVLDEISLSAPTTVCELSDGQFSTYTIKPEDFGLERCTKEELVGGTPEVNAAILRAVFDGEQGAKRNVVLLNAGAALHIAKGISIADGVREAAEIIDSGKAKSKLEEFIAATKEGAGE